MERDHCEDPGSDVRIILKLIMKKRDGQAWVQGRVAGACEIGVEPSDFIICWERLDQLRTS